MEARTGKMATANKIAVVQNIKQEKRVLVRSFANISQNKRNVRIGRK
jgi:nucleoid DNA-binding protein